MAEPTVAPRSSAPAPPAGPDIEVVVTFSVPLRGREVELLWCEGSVSGDDEIIARLERHGYDPDDLPDPVAAIAAVERVVGRELEIHVGDDPDNDEAVRVPDPATDRVIDLRGSGAAPAGPSTFVESWFDSSGLLPTT